MSGCGFTLFETPIGCCAIAWGVRGVTGVQLPEARRSTTLARMRRRFPDADETAPPREVKRAIGAIVALLSGRATDLSAITLDMEQVSPFNRRVYEAARTIPVGSTLSYGEVAARVGSPNSARAVGQALGRNPFAIVVPCHRVLAAGGKAGGFSAGGGVDTKLRMLAIERPGSGAARDAAKPAVKRAVTDESNGAAKPAVKRAATGESNGAAKPAVRRAATGESNGAAKPATSPGGAGVGFDPKAALRHLRSCDAALARLIDAAGPFTLQLNDTHSVFDALAEAIVYQQLTGKAAATIYGRVCALFPRARQGFTPRHILGATDEDLRGAGLSRAKVAALRDLARKTADRELPTLDEVREMPDDDIIERLSAVRGVGRWTVEMLLMLRLGRPDVLPADDYGVRKGFALIHRKADLPTPKELARHGEKWRPFRSVASWYLWRAVELAKS
ncbi:MAG: methylated-DNA--[protein]-cysteine S-methyltransferase [Deltaproteobacteria bacterium]|nr:methylated-DNA--[protein]-cysteine S-methyltransferase [Deltaproteobacteria bacterium]